MKYGDIYVALIRMFCACVCVRALPLTLYAHALLLVHNILKWSWERARRAVLGAGRGSGVMEGVHCTGHSLYRNLSREAIDPPTVQDRPKETALASIYAQM